MTMTVNKTPHVSVIVPVYNAALYIERCAKSLIEQTLEEIEIIFVDDCSPDNSIELVKSLANNYPDRLDRIKYVRHEHNYGATQARKTGLDVAVGEYVAYCDSDDYVSVEMYEKLYDEAERTKSEIVYCDFLMDYGLQKTICCSVELCQDKALFLERYISYGWTVLWNMIVKRSLYLDNPISYPFGISYCEDFYLACQLFYYSKKLSKVSESFYYYNRTNESSVMHGLNSKTADNERKACQFVITFMEKYGLERRLEKVLSWRVLKSKQDLVLFPDKHEEFLKFFPVSRKYIWSCPFCNKKIKVMMWMLTHGMRPIVVGIDKLRFALGR